MKKTFLSVLLLVLRGETGFSTFGEREARTKKTILQKAVERADSNVGLVGRWSLLQNGAGSGRWIRLNCIAKRYDLPKVREVMRSKDLSGSHAKEAEGKVKLATKRHESCLLFARACEGRRDPRLVLAFYVVFFGLVGFVLSLQM